MRKLIWILGVLGWASNAGAANIDVCTVAELKTAISDARPGDDIVMCSRKWRDMRFTFQVNGTADKPITLRAAEPGKTILTGLTSILMAGKYAVVKGLRFQDGGPDKVAVRFRKDSKNQCHHCRLTESTFIDFNTKVAEKDFSYHEWFVKVDGKNNRVDHNYFDGKTSRGQYIDVRVFADSKENHRVDHNFFGHRAKHPSGNDGEAMKIGGHPMEFFRSGSIIEDNYFERINGDFEIISVKGSEITIRHNTFERCEGGLSLRHGRANWVDANYFFGYRDPSKKVSGIRVYGEDHLITNNYISGIKVGRHNGRGGIAFGGGDTVYKEGGRIAPKNVLVAFNTIVDSDRSIGFDLTRPVKASNITFANNIIVSSDGAIISDAATIKGLKFSKNLIQAKSLGVDEAEGLISADPKLVKTDGIKRISNSSPARDLADSRYTPKSWLGSGALFIDADEQQRTGKYDIGADEYTSNGGNGYTKKCDTGPRTYNPKPSHACVDDAQAVPMPPAPLVAM